MCVDFKPKMYADNIKLNFKIEDGENFVPVLTADEPEKTGEVKIEEDLTADNQAGKLIDHFNKHESRSGPGAPTEPPVDKTPVWPQGSEINDPEYYAIKVIMLLEFNYLFTLGEINENFTCWYEKLNKSKFIEIYNRRVM